MFKTPRTPSQHTVTSYKGAYEGAPEGKLTNATPPATIRLNAEPERMLIPTAPLTPEIGLPVAPGEEPTPEAEGATAAVPAGWVEL